MFFVYFSILRAYERGNVWQRMFAFACLVQFLVEVIFYETTECVMVHFLIPDLVRTEVQTAGIALRNIVKQVCTSQSLSLSSSSSNVLLDAPRYLFVSTNVAEKYPDMLESVLIRSYHSYWPGPYSEKWKLDHSSRLSLPIGGSGMLNGVTRGFSVTVVLISLLKEFGASSPGIQRLLLHSVQPLVVAAIFYAGSALLLQPLYFLTLIPVSAYLVYSFRLHLWQLSQDNASCDVHPIEDRKFPVEGVSGYSSIPAPLPINSSPESLPELPLGYFDDSSSDSSLGDGHSCRYPDDSCSHSGSLRHPKSSDSSSYHRQASGPDSSCDTESSNDGDNIISWSSSEDVRSGVIFSSDTSE